MCSTSSYSKNKKGCDRKIMFKDIVYEMAPFYYTTKLFGFSTFSFQNACKTKRNRLRSTFIDLLLYSICLSFFFCGLVFEFIYMDDVPKNGFVIIDVGQMIAYFFHMIIVIISMVFFQFMRKKYSMAICKFQNIDNRVSKIMLWKLFRLKCSLATQSLRGAGVKRIESG